MMTWSKFQTQDQQILGATERDLFARDFWASAVTIGQTADCFRRQVPNVKPYGPDYRGAGKSLARPGRKQGTATEDFEIHISYL